MESMGSRKGGAGWKLRKKRSPFSGLSLCTREGTSLPLRHLPPTFPSSCKACVQRVCQSPPLKLVHSKERGGRVKMGKKFQKI